MTSDKYMYIFDRLRGGSEEGDGGREAAAGNGRVAVTRKRRQRTCPARVSPHWMHIQGGCSPRFLLYILLSCHVLVSFSISFCRLPDLSVGTCSSLSVSLSDSGSVPWLRRVRFFPRVIYLFILFFRCCSLLSADFRAWFRFRELFLCDFLYFALGVNVCTVRVLLKA